MKRSTKDIILPVGSNYSGTKDKQVAKRKWKAGAKRKSAAASYECG